MKTRALLGRRLKPRGHEFTYQSYLDKRKKLINLYCVVNSLQYLIVRKNRLHIFGLDNSVTAEISYPFYSSAFFGGGGEGYGVCLLEPEVTLLSSLNFYIIARYFYRAGAVNVSTRVVMIVAFCSSLGFFF